MNGLDIILISFLGNIFHRSNGNSLQKNPILTECSYDQKSTNKGEYLHEIFTSSEHG